MRPQRPARQTSTDVLLRCAHRVVVLAALALPGCLPMDSRSTLEATRARLPPPAADLAHDQRARFRQVFCALAAAQAMRAESDAQCTQLLWRLADEESLGTPRASLPGLDPRLDVFVVGGAFSDCFGDASLAYGQAIAALSAQGVRVRAVAISSRSGAEHNARMIADAIDAARPAPADVVVLLGYSKGSVDILHFLAEHPDVALLVDAVINVAGPVNGSAVAARGAWAYDTLLQHAFGGRCDPGDGGVVDSLIPERRRAWLSAHPPPAGLRFYVLSAFTTREHMARGLLPTWETLAAADRRNDGQITLEEALMPGATLLGYANADHWGVAIDIERELELVASRPDPTPFPRALLFEAMLRFVCEDLARYRATPRQPAASADNGRAGAR